MSSNPFDVPVSSYNPFNTTPTASSSKPISFGGPAINTPTAESTPMVAQNPGPGFFASLANGAKAVGGFVSDFAKTLFSGDVATAPSQQQTPIEASRPGGIAANTFLDLPVSTVKVGQNMLSDTLGKLGVSVAQDITSLIDPKNKGALDDFVPTGPFAALLGDKPISGLSTDVARQEQAIQNNPIAQQWGLSKFALPLAFGSVIGENAINYTPLGGEEQALKTLAKSTDVGEISSVLRNIGVHEDLIPQVAPKFAEMTNPTDIKAGLEMVENLQKTTKVADALRTDIAPGESLGTQGKLPLGESSAPKSISQEANPSDLASSQDTTNKVDLSITGEGTGSRVQQAIGKSEALSTQITNAGQDAYIAGRSLSQADLSIIRDAYQSGASIADVAAKTSAPKEVTDFLTKMQNYYDFQLAADRAAGGQTARVENYIPQIWDLTKPTDLAKFNQYAAQKGIKPYDGFSAQPRIFNSYAEGEAAGFKPKNSNILKDLQDTYEAASHGIGRQALKRGLLNAAPNYISVAGRGVTDGGKPFINSNAPGLEGLSFHPDVHKMLRGYEPLKNQDFIKLVLKDGAAAATQRSGLGGMIDRTVAAMKSVPKNLDASGPLGTLGSIWNHTSAPLKQLLWNFSGFHSFNITSNFIGKELLHPLDAAKGVGMSVASALSERADAALTNYLKNTLRTDTNGKAWSIYDGAVQSGAIASRGVPLPWNALGKYNPVTAGKRAIFDREIPKMAIQLWDTFGASKGIVPDSPQGLALGKEIHFLMGEVNPRTANLNPNTMRIASHLLLAPGFTVSKARLTRDALTSWVGEDKAVGDFARSAVIGKTVFIGTLATAVTLMATGKLPTLGQLLLNYSVNPSAQTNLTNPKGQKLDITFPKTFISEWASLLLSPVQYANARLNPLLADGIKLYTNQDYNGKPIVDPNVPQSEAMQRAKNLGIGHLPIGLQSVVNTLNGKQSSATSLIQIAGGNTRISANDPQSVKYAAVDKAKAAIANIAPDDPRRYQEIKKIYRALPADQRKVLGFQELLAGVKLSAPKGKGNPFNQ